MGNAIEPAHQLIAERALQIVEVGEIALHVRVQQPALLLEIEVGVRDRHGLAEPVGCRQIHVVGLPHPRTDPIGERFSGGRGGH